jgi:hypothetical protein
MHSAEAKQHFYLKHLSTPLNFSKREPDEPLAQERRKPMKQETEPNDDSGDCEMTQPSEESENVEVE